MLNYQNADYGIFEKYVRTTSEKPSDDYRYLLEMRTEEVIDSENHLVLICMNPSIVDDKITDATANEIIRIMFFMGLHYLIYF